jgi:HSP20 family molecular chaperone IbpA
MQSFDELIKNFFENNDLPNPFDPERFGRFLQEQIQNALPKDPNTLNRVGLNQMGNTDAKGGPNQYPMPPAFDRSKIPGMNQLQGNRKGTTKRLNQAPFSQIPQSTQQSQPQPQQELNYQAFETHDELIVRVQIPKTAQMMPKKIKLTSYHITFNNEERESPLLQIQLPKAVNPDVTKWGFREGILEVRVAKRVFDSSTEIDISSIYNPPAENK